MKMKIKGIGASPGLAMGYVKIYEKNDINIPDYMPKSQGFNLHGKNQSMK